MKTTDIKHKWDQMRKQEGYLQRVDPNHPLDFFVGVNDKSYAQLVLITDIRPDELKSSKALEISVGQRKDGRWATQISSVEKSNEDIFARLCLDLMECSKMAVNETEGLQRVIRRFMSWQKLFVSLHLGLTKSVIKGLVGEILFAKDVLLQHFREEIVMSAWGGPEGADQDYVLPKEWFELKAISTGKDYITISSLNQLEMDVDGYLVVLYVDDVPQTMPGARSVSEIINDMRNRLRVSQGALASFEDKLLGIGYIDSPAYDKMYFTYSKPNYYHVDKEFPRLITTTVPGQIVRAQYDISLSGIEPWKLNEDAVWN